MCECRHEYRSIVINGRISFVESLEEQKNNLFFSSIEEDKKQVVPEYIDKVVINDSDKERRH